MDRNPCVFGNRGYWSECFIFSPLRHDGNNFKYIVHIYNTNNALFIHSD